jgi:capsular polysaccharide biosynthesis protein
MNNFFDNQRILTLIWKRKFHFIIVGIIAILLGAVFSGPTFIKPKFKSTARIYPSNIGVMSEESRTEQMLEILNSNDVKIKMFNAFSLDEAYGISKDEPNYLTYMFDIYNKNVKTSKTQYETVEIEVMDFIPQQACDMCDSIIHFYNQKVGQIHKTKTREMLEILERQLDKKYIEIDTVATELNQVREKTGIIDFKEQVPEVTRGYMTALATGRGSAPDTKEIRNLYNNMIENGADSYWLEKSYYRLVNEIDSINLLYEINLSEFQKNITYSHIVETPYPADKKSYPVRWLIVLFSAFSGVFLALLVFLVLDYKKEE